MDLNMYMHRVDIFPLLFLIFSFLIISQKDFIIPYIIDNHMTDSPYHHSIMYYFTPLWGQHYDEATTRDDPRE